ncbi:MAG TPA: flagellar biosynthesis protein FlhB, partial [Bacillota bacterium]|nr:flagellar biosynthesis protein FlhB [Bacillota bacterium]
PKSAELNSVIVLFGLFILLNTMGGWAFSEIFSYLQNALSAQQLNQMLTDQGIAQLMMQHTLFVAKMFLPLGLGAMLFGVLINYIQVGSLFTLETLKPNFSRINPLSGFQRMFSPRSLVELVKASVKLVIVVYFAYATIKERILILNQSLLRSPLEAVLDVWGILFQVVTKICSFLLVFAFFDYFYQRWEHNKSLRMSKKEVKDEFKQTEGNPQIKGKIRQRQMQIATRRMMQEVPKADVVITNPTHYAIALRYDPGSMAAPVIVAKGEGLIAAKIKEIAAENGVALVENKPLAQTLFKTVEIGEAVPEKLFQAVAEVLAFVYRLKQRGAR